MIFPSHVLMVLSRRSIWLRELVKCWAHLSTHLIISDMSIKLDPDLLYFEWKWDAILLDGLDSNTITLQLALREEGSLFQPTLSDLHKLKLHQKQWSYWWTTLANFAGNSVILFLFMCLIIFLAVHFHWFQQAQQPQQPQQPQVVPADDDNHWSDCEKFVVCVKQSLHLKTEQFRNVLK